MLCYNNNEHKPIRFEKRTQEVPQDGYVDYTHVCRFFYFSMVLILTPHLFILGIVTFIKNGLQIFKERSKQTTKEKQATVNNH